MWRVQYVIACRAPYSAVTGRRRDVDSVVGESVADSEVLRGALLELLGGLEPTTAVASRVQEALFLMVELLALQPDWVAYCDRVANLTPGATDPCSEMSRVWPGGDQVRAWPKYAEARAVTTALAEVVIPLRRELALIVSASKDSALLATAV